jgi:cytosine/adenosine deaminase-related metal-dependent hydrolase
MTATLFEEAAWTSGQEWVIFKCLYRVNRPKRGSLKKKRKEEEKREIREMGGFETLNNVYV